MADENIILDEDGTPKFIPVVPEGEEDNGFANPADTDVEEEADKKSKPELTREQKLDECHFAVMRHPLNREILYKILVFCKEEKPLNVIEEEIATWPDFARATQNQFNLINVLAKHWGLEFIERDEEGNVVTPEMKEGLSEDELDDLVASYHYKTTEIGAEIAAELDPIGRMASLLAIRPERTETYMEVLEFIKEKPRTYPEIQALLKGRPIMKTDVFGTPETLQPSFFVDKLNAVTAIIWDKAWTITPAGEQILADYKAKQESAN